MAGFLFLWTFGGGAFVVWALMARPFSDVTSFLILAVYLLVWAISFFGMLAFYDSTDPVEKQKGIDAFNAHWDSQWEDEDIDRGFFWGEARRLFCKAHTLSSESFFDYPWEHITQGHRFDGIGRPLLTKPRTHRG